MFLREARGRVWGVFRSLGDSPVFISYRFARTLPPASTIQTKAVAVRAALLGGLGHTSQLTLSGGHPELHPQLPGSGFTHCICASNRFIKMHDRLLGCQAAPPSVTDTCRHCSRSLSPLNGEMLRLTITVTLCIFCLSFPIRGGVGPSNVNCKAPAVR